MKRILFLCVVLTALFISCGQTTKQETPVKKTAHETLIREGWEELATVRANMVNTNTNEIRAHEYFCIYYKDTHYIAIKDDYKNKTLGFTRYSVSKGKYVVEEKKFNGRISYHDIPTYFYF